MNTAEGPERLRLGYRLDAGIAVVSLAGEVDVGTCELLRDGLLRVVTDEIDRSLVVNLAGVTFMDSTGLGVLVGVWRRLGTRHGSLALAAPSRSVRHLLDAADLAKVLAVYDLEAEAVQACRRTPARRSRSPGGGRTPPPAAPPARPSTPSPA
jgi:anti-sigma B factor antagonist